MTARFITIDALDGVGKTTLVQDLTRVLGAIAMQTPGPALRPVAGVVLEGLGSNQLARALFYASSVVARGSEARAHVAEGRTVVMDRYWGSTVAYARARGVTTDLDAVRACVPAPDLAVLLVLDERERVRRLHDRGDVTAADRETLEPRFRQRVLDELHECSLRAWCSWVEVDLTGADRAAAVRRVVHALS